MREGLLKALAVPPLPPLTRDERIASRTFAFDPFSAAERKRRGGRRRERREGALNYEPTTAVQNHTRKGGRRERDNAMI